MLDTATPRRIEEYDGAVISRISDYNSNTYEKDDTANIMYNIDEHNLSYISSIISQDADFVQDCSDYQWFADYSLRGDNNGGVCNNMHTSILSSLCTSYGYNNMARDLDANLAQVDMEDFRTEDIHSLLHGLSQICSTDVHNERGGEMYASVSGSIMMRYDLDSSISPRSTSQEDSNGSIYKSEILFSPVREVPLVNFSIDSLDCGEHDIMLTCQANKDNYTIAFEGSTVMERSTDSHYPPENVTNLAGNKSSESVERMSLDTTSSENSNSGNQVDKAFMNKSPLICSESPYTTWSKLKVDSAENILKRQSSGNNNTTAFSSSAGYTNLTASCAFLKSQSLPNLNPAKRQFLFNRRMNHSMRQDRLDEVPEPNQYVKIYNLSKSQCGRKIHRSVFRNNVNFDLISQFISHKHVTNTFRSEDQQGVPPNAFNCKFSKTVENLNESSLMNLEVQSSEVKNKGCDVFQDSLVSDKDFPIDRLDSLAMSDSCSSFSSHSGRLDVLKNNTTSSEGKDASLPSNKIRCSNFMTEKYFESAKDQKKRKVGRKFAIKIMDRSMQTSSSDADSAISPPDSQNQEGSVTKPVYVMYPNYTLPDLSFLEAHATELDLKNVFLWPQKFSPSPTTEHAAAFSAKVERKVEKKKRPCSCPDLKTIRNRDYQHIRDWESLMFLLPREYCKILTEDPELKKYAENLDDFGRSLICTSILSDQEQSVEGEVRTTCVSTCSTGTQPSSGYRGSSTTLLTDSAGSAVRYEDVKSMANRPPLPKGILRNPVVQNIKSKMNNMNTKRYSMFELSREDTKASFEKRRSLPTQFNNSIPKVWETSETHCRLEPNDEKIDEIDANYSEDEGVDSSGSHCDSPGPHSDQDAKRLEYLLETVFHWNDADVSQLKNQNSKKTVSFADRHNRTPPNSPNCSISNQQKSPYQMKLNSTLNTAIHEECENYCQHMSEPRTNSYNFKKEVIDAVDEAAKSIINAGDSEETMAQIALNHLCPALYAVLNHGLRPTLETAFGDINNSVWQVVEASSQQGLMTRALHELVLRLNNEDVLTEGLLKFNAFVFGLLNVRGLDTWFSYLRTRESVLRKHYTDTGILLSSCRGIMSDRQLTDQLMNSLKPLADLTFKLDLLYECRQLHNSLMQLGQNSPPGTNTRTSWVLKKIVRSLQNAASNEKEQDKDDEGDRSVSRPRSCVDSNGFTLNDIASTVRKRWSGIQFGSKLASAFERLAVEDNETYTDSLDHTVNKRNDDTVNDVTCSTIDSDLSITHNEIYDSNRESAELPEFPIRELKFKQLQKKWEMLADKISPETLFASRTMEESSGSPSSTKSRIPRLVTSPVRPPSGLHFSVLPCSRMGSQLKQSPTSPSSNIPTAIPKKAVSPTGAKRVESNINKTARARSANDGNSHSRNVPSSHFTRPSTKVQRRVVDDMRRPASSGRRTNVTSKYVRTLGHRLPSDTGHLSYNEGEKLRMVLEVDNKWILCCRGDQKGLVPRSEVLPISGHL